MDVDGADPFDLETYISSYSGYTKIDRLRFIAECAQGQPLELEALKLAAVELKTRSDNVKLYQKVMELIDGRLGPAFVLDAAWMDKVSADSTRLREKLEDDLNAAKTNSIRESMRRGQMDLGDFHYARGNFLDASKCYMRSRDYCNTSKQMMSFCMAIIKTYIHAKNWTMVATYVQKAEELPDANEDKCCLAKLQAAAGLAYLANHKYAQAASHFAAVEPELGNTFDDIVSGQDIAVYGALSALVALDRKEIRAKCITKPAFTFFVESVPQVGELLETFCASSYAEAFRILADLQSFLQYDIYLADQLNLMVQKIRWRALKQYTLPFDALLIPVMADAFAVDVASLEKELAELIMKGEIHARIDSQGKVLFARQKDQRHATVANVLAAADNYITNARALLLRNQIMKHSLVPHVEGDTVGGAAMFGGHVLEGRQLGWGSRRGGSFAGDTGSAVAGFASSMSRRTP